MRTSVAAVRDWAIDGAVNPSWVQSPTPAKAVPPGSDRLPVSSPVCHPRLLWCQGPLPAAWHQCPDPRIAIPAPVAFLLSRLPYSTCCLHAYACYRVHLMAPVVVGLVRLTANVRQWRHLPWPRGGKKSPSGTISPKIHHINIILMNFGCQLNVQKIISPDIPRKTVACTDDFRIIRTFWSVVTGGDRVVCPRPPWCVGRPARNPLDGSSEQPCANHMTC